jgi:ketosteroid isomerase-like protein
MSRENVEVVRRAWKAYSDRGIEAALDYFAEDCVLEDFPELPDRATYEGRKGFLDRNRQFADTWGDWVIEPVEFIDAGDVDAGDGVVVAVTEMHGSGRGSGVPMDAPAAFVYEVRDGKIVRDRAFSSRSQALEAAGLEE